MRFPPSLVIGATLLTSLASGVSAMPLAPLAGVQNETVTLVRDGCGPYGHRSHYGYCKPNGYEGGEVYVRPRYAPRVYEEDAYAPRCFIRETYYGPRRICR